MTAASLITFEGDVPQVQYGSQQLQDVQTFRLWEEMVHRRADRAIVFGVVPALAWDAATLQQRREATCQSRNTDNAEVEVARLLQYFGKESVFLSFPEAQNHPLLCCYSGEHAVKYVVVSFPLGLD